jgi:hypothetical protein
MRAEEGPVKETWSAPSIIRLLCALKTRYFRWYESDAPWEDLNEEGESEKEEDYDNNADDD